MNRSFLLLLAVLFILQPLIYHEGVSYSDGLPVVYVFEDYRTAASFFLSMSGNERLVLSKNASLTISLLRKLGFPAKEGRARNVIPSNLSPSYLPYLLLYVKEHGGSIDSLVNRIGIDDISKQLSGRRSDVAVLFYSSDGPEYALLAAYAAYLKGARLIDLDRMRPASELLEGIKYVMLVTFPITLENYDRYTDVIDSLISVDDDPYLDSALGVLTGPKISIPFLMLLSSDAVSHGLIRKLRGISLPEDLPLARKVEFIASTYGFGSKIVHPDLGLTNLTMEKAKEVLKDSRNGVIYLNMHGNPYIMALKTDGNVVLTPSGVREAEPLGSVVITLSCDTLRLSDVHHASESIAYAFLESGAFAYIGSTKLEFSIGSEAGTSYPDLILMMTLTGHTLGEAVKIVNNLHIKEYGNRGVDPKEAAYEILLGDPTLILARGNVPYKIRREGKSLEIVPLESTPVIYVRMKAVGGVEPDVRTDLPSVYYRWYTDEDGLFIYISTLSSSYSGYFARDTNVIIEMRKQQRYLELLPYLAILLVITLSIISLIREGRRTR